MKMTIKELVSNVYRLCVDTIFDIQQNRLSVAKNNLGNAAAALKPVMEDLGIKIDLTENDLQPYTIIGYYDDEGRGFTEHVMAKNDNDSVVQFCREHEPLCDSDEARKFWRDNIVIVDVVKGHVESRYDCGHICYASDWPGLTEGKAII